MRLYELTFIVRPDISENDVNEATDRVEKWITDLGNEVVRVNKWGRRRLAYPINNQREGHYFMAEVNLNTSTIPELERNMKLDDAILRYLIIRVDE